MLSIFKKYLPAFQVVFWKEWFAGESFPTICPGFQNNGIVINKVIAVYQYHPGTIIRR